MHWLPSTTELHRVARSISWSISTSRLQAAHRLRHPHGNRGSCPPRRRWTVGIGSCRDSAWLLVQLLRRLGFAARFVSGYSIQLVADVTPVEGPTGVAQDICRSSRMGRGLCAGRGLDRARRHLRHVRGRRPHSALCRRRIIARRRPSKAATPRSIAQPVETRTSTSRWTSAASPRRCGSPSRSPTTRWAGAARSRRDRVDADPDRGRRAADDGRRADLHRRSNDFDAPEWNSDAVGPTKAAYADQLIRKLREEPSRPDRCSITDRANGIPARACRAGAIRSIGAR